MNAVTKNQHPSHCCYFWASFCYFCVTFCLKIFLWVSFTALFESTSLVSLEHIGSWDPDPSAGDSRILHLSPYSTRNFKTCSIIKNMYIPPKQCKFNLFPNTNAVGIKWNRADPVNDPTANHSCQEIIVVGFWNQW